MPAGGMVWVSALIGLAVQVCALIHTACLRTGRALSIPSPLRGSVLGRTGRLSPLRLWNASFGTATIEQEATMSTNQPSTSPAAPTFAAYHVTEPTQEGRKARWTRIGAFFAHADSNGGTLIIEALPVAFNGRIVLRAPTPRA